MKKNVTWTHSYLGGGFPLATQGRVKCSPSTTSRVRGAGRIWGGEGGPASGGGEQNRNVFQHFFLTLLLLLK